MKIMHVIHGLNMGGAETLIKEYAMNLNKELFDVVILCFDHFKDSPYEKILEKNRIKVIYVCDYMKFYNKKSLIFKIINHMQKYVLIRKFIHKETPDILHTHLSINKYIKFARPKKGTKIFHTVHSEPQRLWNFNNKKSYRDFLSAKWLLKKYNMRFIVLHSKMQKEINSMFKTENAIILNNGIDLSKYNKKICMNKNEVRSELGIPQESFVLGHVGRFSKVKNHEFLVNVFNEVYKKNSNGFLLLVGDGSEKEKIKNLLHSLNLDNHYLILSNREDIPNLLNAMDYFVFPSICEGLGISLIEAQEMDIPCFISEGVPEATIISNIVTTLSLELCPNEWAKKILSYKIPQLIELNDSEWDIKETIKKLEKIYLNEL